MALNQDVAFKISAQVTGQSAVDQLKNSLEGVSGSVNGMIGKFTALKGAFAGLAAAVGVMKLADMVENVIDAGDKMNKLSQKTGVSVETLSMFSQAAKLSDVAIEDMAKAFGKYEVAVSKANTGSKEIAAAFSVLGISAKDLKSTSVEELLLRTSDAFSKMADGPTKARLAVDLFGKAGIEMIPMLNMGRDAIEELGVKMSKDFAARAENFNDTLTMIRAKTKLMTTSMVSELLPTLQEIASAFLDMAKTKPDVAGFMDYVGEAARLTTVAVYDLWIGLKQTVDTVLTGGKQVLAFVTGDFDRVDQLGKEWVQRAKERAEDMRAFHDKLLKNSLVFGQGTTEEIKARQRADTAPEIKVGKVIDDSALDTGKVDLYKNAIRDLSVEAAKLQFQAEHVKEFQDRITTAKEAQMQFDTTAKQGKFVELAQGQKDKLVELAKQVDDYSQKLRVAMAALTFENANKKMAAETEAMTLSARERDKLLVGIELENAGIKKNTEEYDRLLKKRQELIDQKYDKQNQFTTGWQQAMNDYVDSAASAANQAKTLFGNAFKGMEDALVNFVKTGKLDFGKLADSIISDLIRIQIQNSITKPLAAAMGSGDMGASIAKMFGFANGGIMTSSGSLPLNKYASGGIASSPQLAMFGEGKTPEAYVPLPDGRSIPVNMTGGGGQGVIVNVMNNGGGTATTKERTDNNGNRVIDVMIEQVKSAIAADITRGTGVVTSALERTYGANRAAGAY